MRFWNYLQASEDCPFTCSICERSLPDPDLLNGDILYTPWIGEDGLSDEDMATIAELWGIADPMVDFGICQACIHDNRIPPWEWLQSHVEEDCKLPSREDCLRYLASLQEPRH